jgi:hypothetical protein
MFPATKIGEEPKREAPKQEVAMSSQDFGIGNGRLFQRARPSVIRVQFLAPEPEIAATEGIADVVDSGLLRETTRRVT